MTEREKLITAIERAREQSEEFGLGFIVVKFKETDLILELLKEQEPRLMKVTENAYGRKFYFCPRCARPIEKSAAIGKPRHCEDCGQELIWE